MSSSSKRKSMEGETSKTSRTVAKVALYNDSSLSTQPIPVSFTDAPQDPNLVFKAFSVPPRPGSILPDPKRRRVVMSYEHPKMNYRSDAADADDEGFCKYLIGVYDKTTGKVTMTAAGTNALRVVAKPKSFSGGKQSKIIGTKNAMARTNLGETFGTVKRKKSIKEIERNKVSQESLLAVQKVINKTIDESAGQSRDERAQIDDDNRPIPPFNRKAKNVADVYKVEDLAPTADLRHINIKRLQSIKKAEEMTKVVGSLNWVLERLQAALAEGGDTMRIQQLVYLSYLIRFFKRKDFHFKTMENLAKAFEGIPTAILDKLVQRFTESESPPSGLTTAQTSTFQKKLSIKFPDRLRDLLLGYIFALCLTLEGFRVNSGEIARTLEIPPTRANTICKELGCRIETKGVERFAVLSVPLKFPTKSLY
ncbi:DNA-directed RNA polymerase I subunit rpa49 [Phlyctochytrium planicorne]|nr:DNA-directed RNA polymerase I subunit rpa49 [Phlyctochytrium planicorne]